MAERLKAIAVARSLCQRLGVLENMGVAHRDDCSTCAKIADTLKAYARAEAAALAAELEERMTTRSRHFAADVVRAWAPL